MISFEKTQQDVAEVKKDIKELKALLLQKAELKQQSDDPKTIDEIAIFTGYTKPTIYGYCQKNEIPYHKKNGRLFFFISEVIEWIKQGKIKTISETEAEVDSYLSKRSKRFK